MQVSCTNNQVHLLKMPNMEVLKTVAGIKVCASKSAVLPFNCLCQQMTSPDFGYPRSDNYSICLRLMAVYIVCVYLPLYRPCLSPQLPIASADLSRRDVYGFDSTNGLVAIPTQDYCIQFYNLFENTEVSEVRQST
jgi:hypothetical protein